MIGDTARTTRDWDFAVDVPDWDAFEAFRQRMVSGEPPRLERAQDAQAFQHSETGVLIEIIPHGPLADANGAIVWPETGAVMLVTGLDETAATADSISVGGEALRVPRPACLVAVKLITFAERRYVRDLEDVNHVLAHATDTDLDRVFETLETELASGALSYEVAGAYLLGLEIAALMRPESIRRVRTILDELLDEEDLASLSKLIPRASLDDWDINVSATKRGSAPSERASTGTTTSHGRAEHAVVAGGAMLMGRRSSPFAAARDVPDRVRRVGWTPRSTRGGLLSGAERVSPAFGGAGPQAAVWAPGRRRG